MLQLPLGVGLAIAAIIALLLYVPNPLRTLLQRTISIRRERFKKAVTTPIQRELAMVAGPQKVIDDSQSQVQDLRGTLVHESNVLMQRQDDLAAAETQYYKAADDASDTGIDELVLLVAEKEQEAALQQRVVDGIQAAVAAACSGVDKARKELRHVQMTIKSDEAIAKATAALDAAGKVLEAARSMTANGGALKEASSEVNRYYVAARARVDGFNDTPAQRELKHLTEQQQLVELRQRLDAKRTVVETPAKSQS
jgi:hypothetical protein